MLFLVDYALAEPVKVGEAAPFEDSNCLLIWLTVEIACEEDRQIFERLTAQLV